MEMAMAQTIDAEEPLSKAISKIRTSGVGVLVTKDGEYFGMIDERQLSSSPKDASKMKCGKLAVKTPVLTKSSSIIDTVNAFFAGRFKSLPVLSGKKIVGMVSRWDLLSELTATKQLSGFKVWQFMTTPVITMESRESIGKAKSLMRDSNIRRLVITENGKISGILSFFDLAKLTLSTPEHVPQLKEKASDDKRPVSAFMRSKIETIGKGAALSEAIAKMLSTKVAALIVIDGSTPVGILTTKDILEAMMRTEGKSTVLISGLHGFEEDAEGVRADCEAFVEKIGKSMKIDALNIHVKKTGKQYFVSAHVHSDRPILASASGWTLHEAVHSALHELSTMSSKAKEKKLATRRAD